MVETTAQDDVIVDETKVEEMVDQGTKMLNGRTPDNALLDNIARKGANSYYYAHAPKDFTTEGAQHFKGDGKIYGGEPVLIKTRSLEESAAERARAEERAAKLKQKQIQKFSWADEESKVRVYIELNQFAGPILESQVEVKFDEQTCEIKVIDSNGVVNLLNFAK